MQCAVIPVASCADVPMLYCANSAYAEYASENWHIKDKSPV